MPSTFSEVPEQWEEIRHSRGMTTPKEAGSIKSRRYNQGDVREFRLLWRTAPIGVKNAIEVDHAATFGGAATMIWTPPGEADALRVRFKPGTSGYSRNRNGARFYAITVGLVEAPEFRTPSTIT